MSRTKGVGFALRPFLEAGKPAVFAEGVHKLPSARKHFVNVALVAYVKNDPIFGAIENTVKGDGKLYHPQIGGKMPAVCRSYVYKLGTYFRRQYL